MVLLDHKTMCGCVFLGTTEFRGGIPLEDGLKPPGKSFDELIFQG